MKLSLSFKKLLVLLTLAFSVVPAVTQEDSAKAAAAPTQVAMAADASRESAGRTSAPARAAQEPANAAVGEPSSYVLMLAGLALIGVMLLRRRNG